jgi:hypothetical protein
VRYTPGWRPARGSHPRERRTPGNVEHQLDEIAPGNSADEPVLDEMVSSLSLYGVVMRQRK